MIDLNKINESKIIDSENRDNDLRGSINSILDTEVKNVSIIVSNQNSLRSNHYHYTDWHIMHVLEGKIHYFFKKLNSQKVNYLLVSQGQNIFTPPNEIHATFFPVKTKLIVSSKNSRDRETYEKDTVRVDFINNENLKIYLEKYTK